MAYYIDKNLEEEQNPNGDFQLGGQGASLNAGAPSSAVSAGASGAPSAKPDNPGNFVGIKQYLDANKNQSNQLGQNVSNKISGTIDQASQGIGGLQSQFEGLANQGAINNLSGAKNEASSLIDQAATQGIGPDQNQKNRFGEITSATYKGPRNLTEANSISNPVYESVKEAQKLADLSKNEAGSKELTKEVSNKDKQYSSGANRLDTYLLNSPENRTRLEGARQNAANLQPALQQAETGAQNYAANLATQSSQLQNDIKNLLKNTALSKYQGVQGNLDQLGNQMNQKNAMIQDLYGILGDPSDGASVSLTPQQMQFLGLQEGQQLYGALNNPAHSLLGEINPFDANRAISKEDQSRLAALSELSGIAGTEFNNPYTMSDLAGTAQYDTNFDQSKLTGKVAEGKQKWETDYNNTPYYFPFGAPGVTPKGPDGRGATFKDLNEKIIPYWDKQGPRGKQIANALRGAFDQYKKDFSYNDVVNRK